MLQEEVVILALYYDHQTMNSVHIVSDTLAVRHLTAIKNGVENINQDTPLLSQALKLKSV